MWMDRFERLVKRKEREACEARVGGFVTAVDLASTLEVERVGSDWTDMRFDGPFYWTRRADGRSLNLVFVRSLDGNTVADNPAELGGGETDKHLVYEGLSRVHVDAVLAGSRTAVGPEDLFFSVWHPELVRLRLSLGKPRHPAQIVVSAQWGTGVRNSLIFNVPDARPILITCDPGAAAIADWARTHPWVTIVSTGTAVDMAAALDRLAEDGIRVVSAIGGRMTAASLLDAGLVGDLYLTTSPKRGGEPNTPLYAKDPIAGSLIVRKRGRGEEQGVVFEHIALDRAGAVEDAAYRV